MKLANANKLHRKSGVRFGEPGDTRPVPSGFLCRAGFWKNVRTKRTMCIKWCLQR
jgi:hypothetical protein